VNWLKLEGKIARKLEFLGQLGVKLKKFAVNDVSVKSTKLWGLNWQKPGVKLKKFKI